MAVALESTVDANRVLALRILVVAHAGSGNALHIPLAEERHPPARAVAISEPTSVFIDLGRTSSIEDI